jgi:hypothetical protein
MHGGARLTDADPFTCATARAALLRRVWGEDADFLRVHGDAYRRILAEQLVVRARWFLRRGRRREARAELRAAGGGPVADRLVASMPALMARAVFAGYDAMKDLGRGARRGVRHSRDVRRWGLGAPRGAS